MLKEKLQLLLLVVSGCLIFTGCSTPPSPTDGCHPSEFGDAIPAALMLECHRLEKAPTDHASIILQTHASNMELAAKCIERHGALVNLLKAREDNAH